MKVRLSQVCLDCDEISIIGSACPSCTSGSQVPLSQWVPEVAPAVFLEDHHTGVEHLDRLERQLRADVFEG